MNTMPEKIINMYRERLKSVSLRLSKLFKGMNDTRIPEDQRLDELWEMRNEIHKLAGTAGYFEDDEVEKRSKEIDRYPLSKSAFADEVKRNFEKIQKYQDVIHKSKYYTND